MRIIMPQYMRLNSNNSTSVSENHSSCSTTVIRSVLNGSRKQFSLAATSVTSALEVIFIMRCAI